jgi:hypothetical protein
MAAQFGILEVVQCLFQELGALINEGDEDGCTPLYIAAQRGYLNVVFFWLMILVLT